MKVWMLNVSFDKSPVLVMYLQSVQIWGGCSPLASQRSRCERTDSGRGIWQFKFPRFFHANVPSKYSWFYYLS